MERHMLPVRIGTGSDTYNGAVPPKELSKMMSVLNLPTATKKKKKKKSVLNRRAFNSNKTPKDIDIRGFDHRPNYMNDSLATDICSRNELPMVIKRKEAKDYGTKKMVEGSFSEGDKCLIIEDTVTSGSSILETAEVLQKEGLEETNDIVPVETEQRGREMLESQGIPFPPIIPMENGTRKRKMNSHGVPAAKKHRGEPKLTYAERAELSGTHPLARKLLKIMEKKKTNLCFSADVTSSEELLQLAESLGPKICILKTHCDILKGFTAKFRQKLKKVAEELNFLIFEDRKFADIGNTVRLQYEGGFYRISSWSHIVNAHAVPGPGVLKGLSAVANPLGHGGLLIAQMSSKGCLATGEYTKTVVKMAEDHRDFVFGFICSSKITEKPEFIHLTPGVKIQANGDQLGQQYRTPEEVINQGSDVIIVGRGILEKSNLNERLEAAELYRKLGWEAYKRKVGLVTSKIPGVESNHCD